jgi:hypothetical protein
MKKLKGIKFKNTNGYGDDYGYTPEPKIPEPRSQADCPMGMVYRPSPTAIACGGIGQSECPPGSCEEPTSQADCPKGTIFSPAYVSYAKERIGAYLNPAQCKELDFGPRSQADCPEGTTFTVFGGGKDDLGMPRVGTAMCLKSKVISKSCEQQYADYLVWLQENGPRIKIKPETKEEFMAKCEGKSAAPTVEPKMMGMSANWLVPAILIGVGVYMLTRKSE